MKVKESLSALEISLEIKFHFFKKLETKVLRLPPLD